MNADDVFPDRGMSHREKLEFMLERWGWAMDSMPGRPDPEAPIPRYAWTVGFEDRFGFPEVCCFGLAPAACQGLFVLVAEALAGGTELPVGAPFIGLLDGGQPCAFLSVDAAAAAAMFPSLEQHQQLAGRPEHGFAMVQLAWPDRAGNLPWEPGFAADLAPVQLLLGDPPG